MPNDFSQQVERRGTASLKWEKYAGRDILPLWVADMDFPSPPAVIDALVSRARYGVFGYTVPGAEVTSAVLDYLRTRHGLAAEADWLVWLPGLVPGLNVTCRAVGEAGDGVLTCTPVYPPFLSAPGFSARRRITVPLRCVDGRWEFDWDALEQAATADTRLFILCNPHNPVGRVWTGEELARLLDFCARRNLVLCSDEIHCDLILDDRSHVPALALGSEAVRRTIALYAPSKTYNVPGLSCAYAVIPDAALRDRFRRAARGVITEINAFGYAGCAAAYRHGEAWRLELIEYLRANRDLVYRELAPLAPRIRLQPMEATYLAWLDVRELGVEAPVAFFEGAGVGLSNGADFGAPGFVRLNFGCPRALLQEGLDRIKAAVRAL